MKMYSIKNEKLGFFNKPIFAESEHEALSLIQNILMSDADRALKGLRNDLSLYYLGEIDFTTGIITASMVDYQSSTDCNNYVCSLSEIFDSIPEESIKSLENDIYSKFKSYADEIEKLKAKCREQDIILARCKKVRY